MEVEIPWFGAVDFWSSALSAEYVVHNDIPWNHDNFLVHEASD